MKRFWVEYTSEAFSRLPHERLIAVLPVGAVEQHGPHLPLSVDAFVAETLAKRLAEALPDGSPAIFLPAQAITKSNEHDRYPGTLTLSVATLIAAWCEIGACVARAGVRKLVLLNAHGGNVPVMDIVARELRVRHGMLVFCVNWWQLGLPEGMYSPDEQRHGIHAGDMETSVMLALDPDNVDLGKARDFRSRTREWESEYRHIGLGRGARPAWQIQDLHPSGACGNAAAASAAKGESTLAFTIERLVEVFEDIDRAPLCALEGEPEW